MATKLHLQTLEGNRSIKAAPACDPAGLSDLLSAKGLALNTRCGKRGLCKGCTVHLEHGALRECASGKLLDTPGDVLACLTEWVPDSELTLTIPSRSLLAHTPSISDDFEIRVSVGDAPLFGGEFGLAIDIGTTTVVVLIAELATGRILARASSFNQQIHLGDNVLSRIERCFSEPAAVAQLQQAICRDTILPLALEACAKAGVAKEQIGGMAVAGNSTMLHLLLGVDPSPMGIAPFTPRFLERQMRSACEIGLGELGNLPVHTLPGLAAYVGADIAAGIFATGLHYESAPALFVDVGTNGEIVLVKGDRLYACATAAGPAFEGAGLSCGMRATQGAIEGIAITLNASKQIAVTLHTIGGLPPERAPGICGSAYVDFLAQARAAGVLTETGRFDAEVVAANPALFQENEEGRVLIFSNAEKPVGISEPDIAALMQAKAAIAAGIQTLLHRENLEPAEIQRVYLAGGFGMHLNIPHATGCGLLPGFAPEQVEIVGNTSLGGAYLAMLDQTVVDELERIRTRAEIIELNLDPGFEDCYIDNLSLPSAV